MDQLIFLREKIQKLSKFHQIEVFKILKKKKVKYTENRNGIFVNMNDLEVSVIALLNEYLTYVETQQDHLEYIEKKKEEYKLSFFNPNKENKSII